MAAGLLKCRRIWVHLLSLKVKEKSLCFDISRLEINFYISFTVCPVFSLQDCMVAKQVWTPAFPQVLGEPWPWTVLACSSWWVQVLCLCKTSPSFARWPMVPKDTEWGWRSPQLGKEPSLKWCRYHSPCAASSAAHLTPAPKVNNNSTLL